MAKMVTEAYEQHGVRVEPLGDDERTEWYVFPQRRATKTQTDPRQTERPTHCTRLVTRGRGSDQCHREALEAAAARTNGDR